MEYTCNGEIIKILEKTSKLGGIYYDVLFKTQTGNHYRSCIYRKCRNFVNWVGFLKVGNLFANLNLINKFGKTFIDADSKFIFLKRGNPEATPDMKPIKNKLPTILQESLF